MNPQLNKKQLFTVQDRLHSIVQNVNMPSSYHDYIYAADGGDKKMVSSNPPIMPYRMEEDYFGVVGKRVICKAQGLTGQEKNICKKQILVKCGRMPVCPPIIGSARCFKRRMDWQNCANATTYTPVGDSTNTGDGGIIDTTGAGGGKSDDAGTGSMGGGMPSWVKPTLIIGGVAVVVIGGALVIRSIAKRKKLSPTSAIHSPASMPKPMVR